MFSFHSCFHPLCLSPHVPLPQGHVVFDASGSRMAWTLIEQLQGERRGRRGRGCQGDQAGAELGCHLGEEYWETSQDCLGASPLPALLI